MQLPFDSYQFFDVFGRYNTAVWPAQIALTLAAFGAVGLALHPRAWSDRAIAFILGALWLWMGGVYHLVFFRRINPAAIGFGALFVLEGVLLIIGGWRRRLRFTRTPTISRLLGVTLITYALLIYPILAHVLGHRYPGTPSFGLPCPTTILTLGLLTWAGPRCPWGVLIIPLLWSAVGAWAAVQLGVWEDLGLVGAGALTFAAALVPVQRPIVSPAAGSRRWTRPA
jgi:hypothetical protein